MNTQLFSEFLGSNDTLRVYKKDKLIFSSGKERLLSLLEYIDKFALLEKDVTVFDRIVGNAAALLLKKVFCYEVYSPLGSELAIQTLNNSGINHHFTEIVSFIQDQNKQGMCPMEKLSLNKSPEEFYQACLSFYSKP